MNAENRECDLFWGAFPIGPNRVPSLTEVTPRTLW